MPDRAGPILLLYIMSQKDGRTYRTDTYESGVPLPQGSFDRQQRTFTLITDGHAPSLGSSRQLRWSTGTVWYDGVELLDRGPVVHVETY